MFRSVYPRSISGCYASSAPRCHHQGIDLFETGPHLLLTVEVVATLGRGPPVANSGYWPILSGITTSLARMSRIERCVWVSLSRQALGALVFRMRRQLIG